MPKKIDRIGRAHEWLTGYNLSGAMSLKEKAEEYLGVLPERDKKRVNVGSLYSAKKIKELSGGGIVGAEIVGEASKKPGSKGYDLLVSFENKTRAGYSLKIQSSSDGVNVRNPTLNSICKALTGSNFEDYLTEKEKKDYFLKGKMYSDGVLKSDVIGSWGAEKLREILKECLDKNPTEFIIRLMAEIRIKTNLILTIVDSNGKFIKQIVDFPDDVKLMASHPEKVSISNNGISVYFSINNSSPIHIDVYMMSNSLGKGKKLRAAIRIKF